MHTLKRLGLVTAMVGGLLAVSRLAPGETTASSADPNRAVAPVTAADPAAFDLVSLGIAELTPDHGAAMAALHIRAVIHNRASDRPWALDVSRARLWLADHRSVGATFVNAELGTLPLATVERGAQVLVDFYFALPTDVAGYGPASFVLSWPMNSPVGTVARAWFDRDRAAARDRVDLDPAPGGAASWWVDPRYPWSEYLHRPGYAVPRAPSQVEVTRAPSSIDARRNPAHTDVECDQW